MLFDFCIDDCFRHYYLRISYSWCFCCDLIQVEIGGLMILALHPLYI